MNDHQGKLKGNIETSSYVNGFHFIHQTSLTDLDICSIHLFCDVGSSYETDELRGVAHFLEHLLFQGTTNKSAADLFKEYDKMGTEFNAFTTKRFTCFYVKCHTENAQKVIDILTDIMKNSTLSKKTMEKEEKVIKQEIRNKLSNHNNSAQNLFDSVVYKNSSFEYPIDDMRYHQAKNKVDRQALVAWYKYFYRPSNMVLSVVSNEPITFWKEMLHASEFTKAEPNALLPKSAMNFPYTENIPYNADVDIIIKNEPTAINTHLIFGFRTINQYSDKKYIFEIMTHILNGMSGRIFTLLRQDSNIVYAANANSEEEEFIGYFSIVTEFASKHLLQVMKILTNMFEDIVKRGFTMEEYNIGKSRMRGQYNMLLEDTNTMTRYNGKEFLVFMRNSKNSLHHKKETIVPFQDRLEKIYNNITLEQVNMAAKEYFKKNNMVISLVSSSQIKLSDIQKISDGFLRK
jgi:predicted Zn-dependent peptidase